MENIRSLELRNVFLLLLGIGICVFAFVFFNGFVGDDKEQIYNYGLVRNLLDLPKVFLYHHEVLEHQGILTGYYKPLMLFYFYFIRSIFGLNPFFYHVPQVLLAIINSFLVFLLFRKFLKPEWALFGSVIFLIHPINQESVAYVSNIQEILFFLFGISALLLIGTQNNKKTLLGSLLLLLSLLSKETGILFIVISCVYILLFVRKKYILNFAAILAPLVAYAILRLASQDTKVFWIEPNPLSKLSLKERLFHIPFLYSYYFKTFFFPNSLTFNQQWIIKNFTFGNMLQPLIFTAISTILIFFSNIFLYLRKAKIFKIFLFFSIWLFIGILPHMQIIPLDATVADRWFYFSSVGVIGLLFIVVQTLIEKKRKYENAALIAVILICLILSFRTFLRNIEWQSAFTLYRNDASRAKSALLENNLGDEYFKMGDFKNAKIHFNNALHIQPDLWIAINNLGTIEEQKGNYETAYSYYEHASKIEKRLPVYENMARALVLDQKQKKAIKLIKSVLPDYPLSANLYLTLSLAYYDLGDLENAYKYAEKSYAISPNEKTSQVINAIKLKMNQIN